MNVRRQTAHGTPLTREFGLKVLNPGLRLFKREVQSLERREGVVIPFVSFRPFLPIDTFTQPRITNSQKAYKVLQESQSP